MRADPLGLDRVAQRLGVQAQRGQRRAQPVRQVGDRLALLGDQLVDAVGEPVQRDADLGDLARPVGRRAGGGVAGAELLRGRPRCRTSGRTMRRVSSSPATDAEQQQRRALPPAEQQPPAASRRSAAASSRRTRGRGSRCRRCRTPAAARAAAGTSPSCGRPAAGRRRRRRAPSPAPSAAAGRRRRPGSVVGAARRRCSRRRVPSGSCTDVGAAVVAELRDVGRRSAALGGRAAAQVAARRRCACVCSGVARRRW